MSIRKPHSKPVTISGSEDSTLSGNITIQDTDGLNTEKLAVTGKSYAHGIV